MNNGFLEYKVNSLVENSKLSPQEKKSIKNNLFYQTPVSTKKMDGDLLFYSQQYNQMLEMNRQQAILINAQLSVQNGLTQVQKTQPETSAPPADTKPSAPPSEEKPAQEKPAPEPSAPPSEEKPTQETSAPEPSAPPSEEKPAPESSTPAVERYVGPKLKQDNKYLVGGSDDKMYEQKYLKYKAKYYNLLSKM